MFCPVRNAHPLKDLIHLLLALPCRNVQIPQRQLHILIHIKFINKIETLEHKPNIALAELCALLLLQLPNLIVQ